MYNSRVNSLSALPLYTKANLGVALGKSQPNLSYWVNKLVKDGILVPLKKGIYRSTLYERGLVPAERVPYWEYLASALCAPSYISLEYVLTNAGLLPEAPTAITSVTTKTTRVIASPGTTFSYRGIKPSLFTGYSPRQFQGKTYFMASVAKALFDFFYFRPELNAKETRVYIQTTSRLNLSVLTRADWLEFAEYYELSKSPKMRKIGRILKRQYAS